MRTLFKVVGWTLGVIVILMVVSYGVIISYKKEILAAVNQEMKQSINGDVEIGDLNITLLHDFPNISLTLKDIYLRGPQYKKYKHDFLKADAVEINVEAMKLFRKQIRIISVDVLNGDIFIFRTKDGYLNLDVFKPRVAKIDTIATEESKSSSLSFGKMSFKNVSFAFHDSLKEKLFGAKFVALENKMTSTDSSIRAHLIGDIDFQGLTFNAAKGTFLENKHTGADLTIDLFLNSRRLIIEPSSLTLEKSVINISGALQFLMPGGNFEIKIQAPKLNYQEGLTVVTQQLRKSLKRLSIGESVGINVLLKGEMGSSVKPSVDITFTVDDSPVSWNKIALKNAFVKGSFTNHRDTALVFDDKNSEVRLDSIHGTIKAIPFKGAVSFHDLTNPFMDLHVLLDSDLKNINSDVDTTRLRFAEGHFTSDISFSGKLREYFDDNITKYHGKLKGETIVKGAKIIYLTKNITVDHLDASFKFTEQRFDIQNIAMKLNDNPIHITGSITGFIPFFLVPEKQGKVFLSVNSPSLDFTSISKRPAKSEFDIKTARKKKKVSDLIDRIYDKLEVQVTFNIDKIKSNNIHGTNLTGNIVLANNELYAKDVKMNVADGQVEFSTALHNLNDEINPFSLKATVRNAGVKEFFHMFNDFNQNTIRSENVDGKLFADIDITAAMNDNFEVLMPRLKGNVTFNLHDGRIHGFEPLENMSNFLMKKRDFSDVQFGEIKANFDIRGSELQIERMEIESTVLTLFLEGRFSLKDSTNLSIQVPLSNLKKRNQDYAPENIGTDAKVGLSVRLKAFNSAGKTVIAFAPFNKKNDRRERRN